MSSDEIKQLAEEVQQLELTLKHKRAALVAAIMGSMDLGVKYEFALNSKDKEVNDH